MLDPLTRGASVRRVVRPLRERGTVWIIGRQKHGGWSEMRAALGDRVPEIIVGVTDRHGRARMLIEGSPNAVREVAAGHFRDKSLQIGVISPSHRWYHEL